MRRIYVVFLFVLTAWASRAQTDTTALSLEECIAMALRQNPEIRATGLGESLVKEQERELRRQFLPQVNASVDYNYYLELPTQLVPASAFGGPDGEFAAAAFGVPHTFNGILDVRQLIFQPELTLGLRALKVGETLAQLQNQQSKEETAYQVSSLYYSVQVLAQQLVFLRENLQTLEQLSDKIRQLRDQGLARSTDVQQLEYNQTNLRTRLSQAEIQYEQLLRQLRLLIGLPANTALAIPAASQNALVPNTLSLADTRTRTELAILDARRSTLELEQERERVSRLPQVGAFARGGFNGFGNSGSSSLLEVYPLAVVGIQLNMPIFDGGARRSRVDQRLIEQKQLDLRRQYLADRTIVEQKNAVDQFRTEWANLNTLKEQIRLATRIYEQVQLQYREGLTDITEVLNARTELDQVQTNYLQAQVAVRQAELEWRKATGALLN